MKSQQFVNQPQIMVLESECIRIGSAGKNNVMNNVLIVVLAILVQAKLLVQQFDDHLTEHHIPGQLIFLEILQLLRKHLVLCLYLINAFRLSFQKPVTALPDFVFRLTLVGIQGLSHLLFGRVDLDLFHDLRAILHHSPQHGGLLLEKPGDFFCLLLLD